MDLNEEVLKGLSILSNETIINDDTLKHILLECVNSLSNTNKQTNLPPTNKLDLVKVVQYSLISLFVEYIRLNEANEDMVTFLINLKIPRSRAELISKIYSDSKINILKNVSSFNDNVIPHITDCVWKLDYVIKNNETLEKELLYRIQLQSDKEPINFNCNRDELQDLLFKLKDIHNHCSKISNSN